METLLDLDPTTGAFIPRLAEKWEANPDMTEWTLLLRKGVPFHFGYGEFTARDVVHSHALVLREEAVATFVGMWRSVSRQLGQSIVFERVEHHWSGIRPAF